MDAEYKKMMLWVLAALIATLLAGVLIVEWTMRRFAQ
jgi:hypothetical protein